MPKITHSTSPIRCRYSAQTFNSARVHSSCTLKQLKSIARQVWGTEIFMANQEFFARAEEVVQKLGSKANQAGFAGDFNAGKHYAAAALAIRAHIYTEDKGEHKRGTPILRKSGELYHYHMVRILERLTEADVPYLGHAAYEATWLHDTVEDTDLVPDHIKAVFGPRVHGIVNALTNLKTPKFQTKLEQAESYDPTFIASIKSCAEAFYIKMADLDDYFNTCKKLSPESQFYHFRFVDEVVYPLATAVMGARQMALAVANKALRINRPSPYFRMDALIQETLERENVDGIERRLGTIVSGIADVKITTRTPYELFIKEREERTRVIRENLYLRPLAQHSHPEFEYYVDRVFRKPLPWEKEPKRDFAPGLRDVAMFDIVTPSVQACYLARQLLTEALPTLPIRSRNFMAKARPNGYQALHEEFEGGIRVRIFTQAMQAINNLGRATRILTNRGMQPLNNPLLSDQVIERVQVEDREGRRHILQRLPRVRHVKVTVVDAADDIASKTFEPFVYLKSTWIDLAAACSPDAALRLSSGRWGQLFVGREALTMPASWLTGQRVSIRLAKTWMGHDLPRVLQEPMARDSVRAFIKSQPRQTQILIGQHMIGHGLKYFFRGEDRLPFYLFNTALVDREYHEMDWLADAIENILRNCHWPSAPVFYRAIALGKIPVLKIMAIMHKDFHNEHLRAPIGRDEL